MTKTDYIKNLAINQNGEKMPVSTLADCLNQANYRTSYGETYKGKRGTHTLVKATYKCLVAEGNQEEANIVAATFTDSFGRLAFQKNKLH